MNKLCPIGLTSLFKLSVSVSIISGFGIFASLGLAETNSASYLFQQVEALKAKKETIRLREAYGTKMFYDPVRDIAGALKGSQYTDTDRSWVESGLIVYDVYRQLGGEKLNQPIFFQVKDGLFFVSVSNFKSSWHSDRDQALINFFFSLINQSKVISSSTSKSNFLNQSKKDLIQIEKVLSQAIGNRSLSPALRGSERLELNFSDSEIVIAAPSLQVHHPNTINKGVTATVSRQGNPKPGTTTVFGFSSDQKFRPKNYQEIILTEGSHDEIHINSSDFVSSEEKKISNNLLDSIITSGEVKRYSIQLNNSANVKISSVGPSDMAATITEKKTGTIIKRDDDSGTGYNFSINQRLKAGAYILEVRHCCAGTGAFGLKVETSPRK
ncbi:hypothetical protein OAN59_01115 [Alphaproteobacteria bacterium]|nr:hypothetical protein [Alphaproteobacteria bacterium]